MINKTTITIKDAFCEASVTKEAPNLEDMLELIETVLRAHGFCFVGQLTIKNEEEDDK